MPQLSERLSAIATLIPKGDRVADIGTDHAYLPIHLRQEDISPFVLACDIRTSPLGSAMKNVQQSGVDGIDFRLCDGLDGINCDEVDTVVLAGMGGQCIAGILERCPWVKNSGKRFIMQPINSPEELRKHLLDGYTFISERAVHDCDRVYTVIEAVALPSKKKYSEGFIYTGLLDPAVSADRLFLEKQLRRLSCCAEELKSVEGEEERYRFYNSAAQSILKYIEV